ncbi:hypothetical protein [Mongoliitalea daihaiensis]|uniref:hypothetical protein n=1 Tax=Mongoliitalea daihaiensis TaxID=2782006 RepID=UPI001F23ADB4|nr:hypothetical protein [Mongoliitalea daihaiensis]UJP66089.1 hypothetical protein IPZ59_05550 [Mongoliitalea daihaiensis]
MKTMYSLVFAMLISMVTVANPGSGNPEKSAVSLREIEKGKLQLLYGENTASTLVVRIYNENRTMIQRDVINTKQAFSKYYDFSNLGPGIYRMDVLDGTDLVGQKFIDLTPKINKPVVFSKVERTENNQFKLLVNSLLTSNMSVYVFENNRLIHEENIEDSKGFQKVYKIKNLNPRAKVEFLVRTEDGFSQLIAVK